MRAIWVMGALAISACGAPPNAGVDAGVDAGVGVPDSGTPGVVDAGAVDAGPCGLKASAGGSVITEGGRLALELEFDGPVVSWSPEVTGLVMATKVDQTHLAVKAPHGDLAPSTVTVAIECAARKGSGTIPLTVHRPEWKLLKKWVEVTEGPINREYGVGWLDSGDPNRLLVFGGFHYKPKQFTASSDLWEMNLTTQKWAEVTMANAAPQFMGGRVAGIPGKREVLFFGGVTGTFDAVPHLDRFEYAPDKLSWSAVVATGASTVGDYQPGFVFDSKRNRYLSFCGQSTGFHCAVRRLELNGTAAAWVDEPVTGTQPIGRSGHFFAYDATTDRVIVFGGMRSGNDMLGDTWALELGETPARWVKLADNPELKRRNGAFALDEKNHRFVVWGGTPDGASAVDGIHAFDLDRGFETWRKMETTGTAPAPRASGMAVADPANRRLLMGFGNSSTGYYPDLWSIDY